MAGAVFEITKLSILIRILRGKRKFDDLGMIVELIIGVIVLCISVSFKR